MRAANSQLLEENRSLNHRLEELLQKLLHISPEQGGISGGKRERTSDSYSDDLPNKKEKVGFFGHSKSSFPKDSASANQGMYSTNAITDDENSNIGKEGSSTSIGSTSSSDETGQQFTSQLHPLSREQKASQHTRKLNRAKRSTRHHQHHSNDWERDIDNYNDQESLKTNIQVEKSLKKKKLPILPSYLLKYDDPDISTDSDTYHDVFRLNLQAITKLVKNFFQGSPYYRTFISSSHVFEFLDHYESISDRDWDNDDDMLLLYMILCISIQRLSPKDFVDLNLLSVGSVNTCTKYRKYLTRQVLYKNFERLKANLVNESLQTIQAYILSTEWLFLEQKYEECWSTMFHACSISYSIGLHIMGQYGLPDANQNSKINTLASGAAEDSDVSSDKKDQSSLSGEDDDKSQNEELDVARYRLWFALKYHTSVICSIFGRPNPISVHVEMNRANGEAGDSIPDKKIDVLLKIGSSELLRLSNLMLIENYMINIDFDKLMELEDSFNRELSILDKAFHHLDNPSSGSVPEFSSSSASPNIMELLCHDDFTNRPLSFNQLDILSDIIVLSINKGKLFEPFIQKFENKDGYDKILEIQIKYVNHFLQSINAFVEIFLRQYLEQNLPNNSSSSEDDRNKMSANYGPVKFGKLIKTYHPFLNSLLCQGVIVIFTFLHTKSKSFVENDKTSMLNNTFLKMVETNLRFLLDFESRMSTKFITTSRMWSSNMVYLINRVLNLIKLIYEKQETVGSGEMGRSGTEESLPETIPNDFPITTARGNLSYLLNINPFGDPSQFEYLNGFHLNDPFWLSVPENLPYYLGQVSDGNKGATKQFAGATNASSSASSTNTPPPSTMKPVSSNFGVNECNSSWNDASASSKEPQTIDPITQQQQQQQNSNLSYMFPQQMANYDSSSFANYYDPATQQNTEKQK
ncbi:hypothetical protein SBY92_000030 [Candida maltosa Xu316]